MINTRNNLINWPYILNNILYYSAICLVYGMLLYLAVQNLTYDFFWYDESGQFFISQGLNHFSPPLSSRGTIGDVITSNAYYNQDPGGYGVLLYIWTFFSTNTVWLRFLSFLFMIGAIIFSILACMQTLNSYKLAFLSGLLIFSLLGSSHFYELRAYSMELCGIATGIWLMMWIYRSVSFKKIITASILLCFFATARYTTLIFCAIFACFILVGILTSKLERKLKIYYSVIFSFPLLVTACLIYIFATQIQNKNLEPLFYISYFPEKKEFIIFLLVSVLITLPFKIMGRWMRVLIIFFWCTNICFMILGFFSILPWGFYGLKGGPFWWLLEFTVFCSVSSLITKKQPKLFSYWIVLIIVMFIVGRIIYTWGGSGLSRKYNMNVPNIIAVIKNNPGTIYVNRFGCPEVRFYFEYGCLKDRTKSAGYPEKFKFLNGIPHNRGRDKTLEINREKRKKLFFEEMPINSIMLGDYMREDSMWIDKFDRSIQYVNVKIIK